VAAPQAEAAVVAAVAAGNSQFQVNLSQTSRSDADPCLASPAASRTRDRERCGDLSWKYLAESDSQFHLLSTLNRLL